MVRFSFEFNDTAAQVFHYLSQTPEQHLRTEEAAVVGTELTARKVRFSLEGLVAVKFVNQDSFADQHLEAPAKVANHPKRYFFTPTELGCEQYRDFVVGKLSLYETLAADLVAPEAE